MLLDLTGDCPYLYPDSETALTFVLNLRATSALRLGFGSLTITPVGDTILQELKDEIVLEVYPQIWLVSHQRGYARVALTSQEDVEFDVCFERDGQVAYFQRATYVVYLRPSKEQLVIMPGTSEIPLLKMHVPGLLVTPKLAPPTLWEHLQE